MAQRRMFSKDITENDAFLDMPLSTQALYFHLGMQADDDGFVTPNRIVRMLGGQPDDLKLLIAKKFILPFEDGVVVIKHWKINNYIQTDRKKDTPHQDKLAMLTVKDNNGYKLDTECIQFVRLGKDSIGKDRLKNTSSKMMEEDFNIFWLAYPRKIEKKKARTKFIKLGKDKLPAILEALDKAKNTDQWKKDKGQFIPHPTSWLNGERWEDEIQEKTLEEIAQDMVDECEAEYGMEDGANIARTRFTTKYFPEKNDQRIIKFFPIFKF